MAQTSTLYLRVPPELHDSLKEMATAAGDTVNGVAVAALTAYVEAASPAQFLRAATASYVNSMVSNTLGSPKAISGASYDEVIKKLGGK